MPIYAATPEDEERAKAAAQAKFFSGMETQPYAQKPMGGPLPPVPQTDDTGYPRPTTEPPAYLGPPATGGRPGPAYVGPPVPGPVISPAPGSQPPHFLGPPATSPGPRGGPGYLGPPATNPGPRPGPQYLGPPISSGGGPGMIGPPAQEPPWYRPRFRPPTTQFGTRFGMR